jgi:hypothetical protein
MCVRRRRVKIIIILFNPGVSSSPAKWPPRPKVTKIGSKRSKMPRRDALLISDLVDIRSLPRGPFLPIAREPRLSLSPSVLTRSFPLREPRPSLFPFTLLSFTPNRNDRKSEPRSPPTAAQWAKIPKTWSQVSKKKFPFRNFLLMEYM